MASQYVFIIGAVVAVFVAIVAMYIQQINK